MKKGMIKKDKLSIEEIDEEIEARRAKITGVIFFGLLVLFALWVSDLWDYSSFLQWYLGFSIFEMIFLIFTSVLWVSIIFSPVNNFKVKVDKQMNHKTIIGLDKQKLEELILNARSNGFTLLGTSKELSSLAKILTPNETIKAVVSGLQGANTVLLVGTDKRVIFLDKGFIYGNMVTSIPLNKINSFSYEKGLMMGSIKIWHGGASIEINGILLSLLEDFTQLLDSYIYNEVA